MQIVDIENVRKKSNDLIFIDTLISANIKFRAKPEGKSLSFVLSTTDKLFQWVYPITIYKVCQLTNLPVVLKGITN